MRLYPAVSEQEAYDWLKGQAAETWGAERLPELEESLQRLAEAMAVISATVLPDELEPLFP